MSEVDEEVSPATGQEPAVEGEPVEGEPVEAEGTTSDQSRRRLGDVLVDAGVLTDIELASVLEHQRTADGRRRRIGELLVELGFADEKVIAGALAAQLGLDTIDLSRSVPAPDVVRLLPRAVAERTQALVVDRTVDGVVVAVADPTNVLALDDVRLHTGASELTVLVSTASQIKDHLARSWSLGHDSSGVDAIVDDMADDGDDYLDSIGSSDDEAPIVKLVNRVLADAVRLRASDIHIEVQRDALRVRYRVDGMLRDVMTAPRRVAASVISRTKIISGLDIAERRVPQDGRARIQVDGASIDCRVSTLPSLHGEKIVIRLLTRGDAVPGLAALGFEPAQLETFQSALAVPQGLVLITGPTGSGKTNTLYAAIAEILTP
ncbi:MAG TPA: ATPase, T2SS/T4P/T4SS family, partial [Actinomycetales bacterium]|nr:ATPase, T2SS/T4P/T4SS family [Actinomycetales bacterium]